MTQIKSFLKWELCHQYVREHNSQYFRIHLYLHAVYIIVLWWWVRTVETFFQFPNNMWSNANRTSCTIFVLWCMFAMGENRWRLWPKLWYVNIIQFILNKTNLWEVADFLGLGCVFYSKPMWLEIIASSDIDLLVLLSFDQQTIPLGKQ